MWIAFRKPKSTISGGTPSAWFSLTSSKDANGFVRHVFSLQNDVFTNSIFYDLYQFVWYRNQFYWSVVFQLCSLHFFFLIASHLPLCISLLSRLISEISSLAVSYFSFFRMLGWMLPGPWALLLFALLNCSENLFCGQFDLRLFWLVPGKTGSHVDTSTTSSEENIDANHSFSFLAIGPSFPEYPIYTLIIFQAIDFLTGFLFLRYLRTFLLVTSVPLGGHFFFLIWFASLEFYIQQDKFAFFYFPHLHRICAFRWMAILL